MEKKIHDDMKSSIQARGLRIASIRKSLGFNQEEFAQQLSVSKHSIHNWEKSKNGGLGERKAREIIGPLRLLGVNCSLEWLLYGIEPAPKFKDPFSSLHVMEQLADPSALFSKNEEAEHIAKEINTFRTNYPGQTLEMLVSDDSMEPLYHKNQYVAGVKSSGAQIENLVEKECIVQTSNGHLLLRHLKKGSLPGHYHLTCINMNSSIEEPFLSNVKLISAAAVIWVRTKIAKA